jgi:YegS/Rv2252/BmrU family lipid kinase
MTRVAVIAHAGKTLDGGLPALRRALARRGIEKPEWHEVPKSRKATKQLEKAIGNGAELVFVWGGDGMVQRCVDVLAGTDVTMAVVPAGTANLFASNLGIPKDIDQAVDAGLVGARRRLDVGRLNGEAFAVMAGAGFDARMIADAGRTLKDHVGRLAYVWTGARNLRRKPFKAKVTIDGSEWFHGAASCILVGNVGKLFAGVEAFEGARPDDGMLDVGLITADGAVDWARTIARATLGSPERSPFVQTTRASSVKVRLDHKVPFELDGGERGKVRKLDVEVEPCAIEVCVPA